MFADEHVSVRLELGEQDPVVQYFDGWQDCEAQRNLQRLLARLSRRALRLDPIFLLQLDLKDVQLLMMSEPFSNLAPVDKELLLSTGVPAEAILEGIDGSFRLDVAYVRELGWSVDDDSLSPP
jgi:hypothetical protein